MTGAALLTVLAASLHLGGTPASCTHVTPLLGVDRPAIVSGNFRDTQGGCYVWLNLNARLPRRMSGICKLTLHELGHLDGQRHSPDPNSVMYSPYRASPVPDICRH